MTDLMHTFLAVSQIPEVTTSSVQLLDAVKTGGALAFCIMVLQIAIIVGKQLHSVHPVIKKYGKVVVTVLSATMAILSSIAVGLSWMEAVVLFMGTAGTSFVHDLFKEIGLGHNDTKVDPTATGGT